jgi:virginiamycin B lyase
MVAYVSAPTSSMADSHSQLSEISISTGAGPLDIIDGPGGTLWFIELVANKIGETTTKGEFKEFTVPTRDSNVRGITTGPDNAIWFTEFIGGKIGRIAPDGRITEYGLGPCKYPGKIAAGSGNILWFTVGSSRRVIAPFPSGCPDYAAVGRITTGGAVTEFPLPSDAQGIAPGPDGSLWFTQDGAIGKMTAQGAITMYPIDKGSRPSDLVAANDGSLWFSDYFADTVSHVATTGNVHLIKTVSISSRPGPLTITRNGIVWFTDADTDSIDSITRTGAILQKELPRHSYPYGITVGPDGAIWFTEYNVDKIGRFVQ